MDRRAAEHRSNEWLGQHFLRSPKLAASLVDRVNLSSSDLVIEVGAGHGMLTNELVGRAALVIAVEVDPSLAIGLVRRFSHEDAVIVAAGDFFDLPRPADEFRLFGNVPFDKTTRLLRNVLDVAGSHMRRADLIVQHGAAIKRARSRNLLNLCWAPWWDFSMGKRIPSSAFRPRPSVDAAVLTISKKTTPLLPDREAVGFAQFARNAWSARDVRTAMKPFVHDRRLHHLSTQLRFPLGASPAKLDVQQWVALYRAIAE
ncbi:MAG TPA: rRNA adenine N(6)-methyltransferase family protein [Actinomycetota bacterium]|nr:rRNA adenine N(6)-methyltransferase family protein [Actinomycetota bacterium]